MSKVRVEFTTDDGLVLANEYDMDMTSGDDIGVVINAAEDFLNDESNLRVVR